MFSTFIIHFYQRSPCSFSSTITVSHDIQRHRSWV